MAEPGAGGHAGGRVMTAMTAEHGPKQRTRASAGSVDRRRDAILGRLEEHGRVEVGTLSGELGVTEETIRRDLRALELAGALQRAHGGAVRNDTGSTGPSGTPAALAARAADILRPVSTFFLGGGAACEALAAQLASTPDTVIVTASVPVALAAVLSDERAVVHLLGGTTDARGLAVGAWAREQLAGLRLDAAVVEAQSIGADGHLLHASPEEAAVVSAAGAVAGMTILLGDPASFGHGGLAASIMSSRLDVAILGTGVAPGVIESLVGADVRVETIGIAA